MGPSVNFIKHSGNLGPSVNFIKHGGNFGATCQFHKKEWRFEVNRQFSEQRVRVWSYLSCFQKRECGLGPPVSFQTTVVCNETPVNQLGYKSLRAIL